MGQIALCLWFDGRAEEAANFYVSAFRACGRDAALGDILRFGDAGPGPKGSVLSVTFRLADQDIIALNGGPQFAFSPAVSLFVKCTDQAQVDGFWERLSDGGQPGQCGWLTDRFGVSWQIVPLALLDMLQDPDPARAGRVMQALLRMSKLDIAALERARRGDTAV